MNIPIIGARYRYPRGKEIFVVSEIRTNVVVFECGHWCTDCVFEDLKLVSSQLELF